MPSSSVTHYRLHISLLLGLVLPSQVATSNVAGPGQLIASEELLVSNPCHVSHSIRLQSYK